ncbi:MAG: hypothetical protein R3D66_04650 [Alphaproteobacteria bacterium]
MAYNTETRQHYRSAAETQPPITGFFTLASHGEPPAEDLLHNNDVAAVHEAAKAEAKQALEYGVQAATGVEGANGGAQERSLQARQGATSGAHAREDEERRKARHADNAYILLMLRLDQLREDIDRINENITRMREKIKTFEEKFKSPDKKQGFAAYYAAKYLGDDFKHERLGGTKEAYSFLIAREIQKRIDKGEIVIDAAEDPFLEEGLKHYRDLEQEQEILRRKEKELKEGEAMVKKAQVEVKEERVEVKEERVEVKEEQVDNVQHAKQALTLQERISEVEVAFSHAKTDEEFEALNQKLEQLMLQAQATATENGPASNLGQQFIAAHDGKPQPAEQETERMLASSQGIKPTILGKTV